MLRRIILVLMVVAALALPASSQTLLLKSIDFEPIQLNQNLADNHSFENGNGTPSGYTWDKRNTDSTCTLDKTVSHSGNYSLKLTNKTPFGAHIYGMLTADKPIEIQAGMPYTISAWVKSDEPGISWIGGGVGWQFRLGFPKTNGKWQRISMTFTPSTADVPFMMRIITESPTPGIWIDDIKLEAGGDASPVESAGGKETVYISAQSAEKYIESDGDFTVSFVVLATKPVSSTVVASLSSPKQTICKKLEVNKGAYKINIHGKASALDDRQRTITLSIPSDKNKSASAVSSVRFYSISGAKLRLNILSKKLPDLKQQLLKCRNRKQDISYPLVTYTVLENFIPYVQEDINKGETRRAIMQINDIEEMSERLQSTLKSVLSGKTKLPIVHRWAADKRPVVRSSSFMTSIKTPGQTATSIRPMFFTGYGHFSQVVKDIEKFPDYGVNIIQLEIGPSSVFPADGELDLAGIQKIQSILDRCQKSGIMLNLLISPHYMCNWMYDKYPDIRVQRDGFLQYCLHAPTTKELLQKYIQTVIPLIKDHPALHSICLSNEPVNKEFPCKYAEAEWTEWLTDRHGDITSLNKKWASKYQRFEDIELPDPFSVDDKADLCRWMDFIYFNQDFFAQWHKAMADEVHKIAPSLPVHAKAMSWTFAGESETSFGVEAYKFGTFSDINGNDAVNWYNFGAGEFAQGWQLNALNHDLQRSVKDAPVFNSENHLIVDRETRYIPAEHVRNVLWQAAIHGQSATTIWVWERAFDPKSDFAGSIMHRPECAEAVGIVNYDLNRLCDEVTAIQQAPCPVAILSSTSSLTKNSGHMACVYNLYTALAFRGIKTGFVTERQLEDGILPPSKIVIVPNARYLSDKARETLAEFKGKILLIGDENNLLMNEYGSRCPAIAQTVKLPINSSSGWQEIWRLLPSELKKFGIGSRLNITDHRNKPVWGIAWREAVTPKGLVFNLSNMRNEKVTVFLKMDNKSGKFVNLLTGKQVAGKITLAPMEIALLRSVK